jgi:hypothetical protein
MSKAILLIVALVSIALIVGESVCAATGSPLHGREAGLAGAIGLIAAITGLLPLQLRADRSAVALFQSAWIGSILHMAIAAALGMGAIYFLKLSTPFVVWLLAMYWMTLIGLCVVLVKAMRASGPVTDQPGSGQQVTFG